MSLQHLRILVQQREGSVINVGVTERGNALLQADGGSIEVEAGALQDLIEATMLALTAGKRLTRRRRRHDDLGDRGDHSGV